MAACAVAQSLADTDVKCVAAAFDGVGLQVVAGGGAQGASGGDVKLPVVERAFDDAVNDEAIGKVGVFVCAEPVGGVEAVAIEPVDGERSAAEIEADYVLFFDVSTGPTSTQFSEDSAAACG